MAFMKHEYEAILKKRLFGWRGLGEIKNMIVELKNLMEQEP